MRRAEEDHCRRAATDSQMSLIVRGRPPPSDLWETHVGQNTSKLYISSLPLSLCRRHRTLTLADSCRTIKHQPPPPPPPRRRQKSSHAANAEWNLCTNADRQTDTVGVISFPRASVVAKPHSWHGRGIHKYSHQKVCPKGPKVINNFGELVNSKSRTIAQMRWD